MKLHGVHFDNDQRFKLKVTVAALLVLAVGLLGVFASSVGGLSWDYAHTAAGQPLFERYSFIAGLIILSIWSIVAVSALVIWISNRRHRSRGER
ncbi:UNVERIFIED_ORG: hypothetical protein M2328_006764 [Rhodococcus erythropolis]